MEAPEVITNRKTRAGRVLLPWQEEWRRDKSPLKLWEKSRRIGATYTEANDVSMTRLTGERPMDYWFSSADESAAYEFAEYVRWWNRKAGAVADIVTEVTEDPETKKAGTSYVVRFPNGHRMTAMTSNPRRFRSKGGDVGLDEFAYHDDPRAMYMAAEPCTMWGGVVRVLSTHNGDGSLFNDFCNMGRRVKSGAAQAGDIPWSLHRITIVEAVEQGLVERINETRGTNTTREAFLADRRSRCVSEDQWQQEYMAVPATDSTAWLPYSLIETCESDQAGLPNIDEKGLRYVGCDVGENKDLTTIWTVERVGDVFWTREIVELRGESLALKEAALLQRVSDPRVVRAVVDGTGVGAQMAQAAERTGKAEGLKFSLPVKDALASPLRRLFEDRSIRVPRSAAVREDLHSVRMTRTASGHPRFDAARSEAGHADRFWALAMAIYAAGNTTSAGVIRL